VTTAAAKNAVFIVFVIIRENIKLSKRHTLKLGKNSGGGMFWPIFCLAKSPKCLPLFIGDF
jgi:hypothetical protein